MPGKIFISYRRDDDPAAAARVRDGLAAKFGKNSLFMDVDNLLAGLRFDEELSKALTVSDVFIAIIGARWMDALKARIGTGERDYVREEIAAALLRKIVVIPVRVGRDGHLPPLPNASDLPAGIADLVLYQKHDVTHEYFGRDVGALAEAITIVRRRAGAQSHGVTLRATLGWSGALVAAAVAMGGAWSFYSGGLLPWSQATPIAAPPTKLHDAKIIEAEAQRRDEQDQKTLSRDAKASQLLKLEQASRQAKLEEDAAAARDSEHQPSTPTSPQVTIRRSSVSAGSGGTPFDDLDSNPTGRRITGLDVTIARNPANNDEKIIGRLALLWDDVRGPSHGGGWPGTPATPTSHIEFKPAELITKVVIFRRKYTWAPNEVAPVWVAGLQIQTTARTYSFGDTNVGGGVTCSPASGEQIIGLFGRAGSYIDDLGCVFAKLTEQPVANRKPTGHPTLQGIQ